MNAVTETTRQKPKKRNSQKGAPPYLADPRKERPEEKIGGGFFVFRRGGGTGRIRAPEYPFEHPTLAAADAEAARLAERFPREVFVVVAQIGGTVAGGADAS